MCPSISYPFKYITIIIPFALERVIFAEDILKLKMNQHTRLSQLDFENT